jgi:hypothetical protein
VKELKISEMSLSSELCVGEGLPYIGQHISNTQTILQLLAGDEKSIPAMTCPNIPLAAFIVPEFGLSSELHALAIPMCEW